MALIKKYGMGWIPDYPDLRDYTDQPEDIKLAFWGKGLLKVKSLPSSTDLRPWCLPVENQGNIGSCTAHAGAGVIEYYERKAHRYIAAFPL